MSRNITTNAKTFLKQKSFKIRFSSRPSKIIESRSSIEESSCYISTPFSRTCGDIKTERRRGIGEKVEAEEEGEEEKE